LQDFKLRLQADKVNASWLTYHEVFNNFMSRLIHKQRLGYKWWVPSVPQNQCFPWLDEEQFPDGKTVAKIASFAPGKITRQVIIDWYSWKMIIDQKDHVDGTLSETREIEVPGDWLFAMKVMKWPGPNAQIQEMTTKEDLYSQAVQRLKEKEELQVVKASVGVLLEELKEDAMLRLI